MYVFLLALFGRVDDFLGLILTYASSVNSSLLNSLLVDLLQRNISDIKAAAEKYNNEQVRKRSFSKIQHSLNSEYTIISLNLNYTYLRHQ